MFSLCFFFFKQKTAYEMRISDWSSDVCSSDLKCEQSEQNEAAFMRAGKQGARQKRERRKPVRGYEDAARADMIRCPRAEQERNGVTQEIGRAPCRERVWSYV